MKMYPGLTLRPTAIELALDEAFHRSVNAWRSPFVHLPMPVRFRAAGAVRAWQSAFAEGTGGKALQTLVRDPKRGPLTLKAQLAEFALSNTGAWLRAVSDRDQIFHSARDFVYWLAFWLRDGVLYEPTPALSTLLGVSDIAHDLPLRFLRPPAPAMCIVPPREHQAMCAGMPAILVFSHDASPKQAPALRCLTIVVQSVTRANGQVIADTWYLPLPVKDEDMPIHEALSQTVPSESPERQLSKSPDSRDLMSATEWGEILNYLVKVLLYVSLDQAVLGAERPYSLAPRHFSGLGKRKRELRLAEIEQLYDRYIVGPAVLPMLADVAPSSMGGDGHHVSPHWRRGHFRMQPHGPQHSLRKLMFIAPILVAADRLEGDAPAPKAHVATGR